MSREVSLKNPFPNGFVNWPSEAHDYQSHWEQLAEAHKRGEPIYMKFVSGDRKGSIARFIPNDKGIQVRLDTHARVWVAHNQQAGTRFNHTAQGHYEWDGRRNKVKGYITSPEVVWLPDYVGETVWEKFDAKAAREAATTNPDVTDIDGNGLKVGDKVLYINARYGSAMELDHGTVDRFEAKASRASVEVFVIVKNAAGVESKLGSPAAMIWKKP